MKTLLISTVTALSLSAAAQAGLPTFINLADANSAARIDVGGTAAGMSNWLVDDVDRLALQGFWYRTGDMTREENIGTLGVVNAISTDTNPFSDNRQDTASIRYVGQNGASGGSFFIDTSWTIRGSTNGSGRADISEQIVITNNSTFLPLTISFFQYADFDLGTAQTPTIDQSVAILGANRNTASQVGALLLNETIVTPAPTRWSASSQALLAAALTDNAITNLDNVTNFAGPADLAWGFQWDFVIQPGLSVVITKDKSLVPTPGAAALLGLGGLIAARRRRA